MSSTTTEDEDGVGESEGMREHITSERFLSWTLRGRLPKETLQVRCPHPVFLHDSEDFCRGRFYLPFRRGDGIPPRLLVRRVGGLKGRPDSMVKDVTTEIKWDTNRRKGRNRVKSEGPIEGLWWRVYLVDFSYSVVYF